MQYSLCSLRNILYGDFDIVQRAMFFGQYVQYSMCVTLTLCKVKCSLCNILYGGFDFVQSAMFFVLSVKYLQYVQYALCLTLTAGLKTD